MRYLVWIMILAILAGGCSKNGSDRQSEASLVPLKDSTLLDISYGVDKQQRMDIYLPAGRTRATPLMVIIHGGGWSSGDKSEFSAFLPEFKKILPEYALATLNYRLVSGKLNRFPTQENDISSAIGFLKEQASRYAISADQMIFVGFSAGAHLALLQGYKHADIARPKAIVSFFGPVDLTALYKSAAVHNPLPGVLEAITGYSPDENPAIYREASPLFYADAQSSPTILLHGGKDALVPVEQAYVMQRLLDSLHVKNKLVVYPDEGHGWSGDKLSDSFNQIRAFISSL